MTRPLFFTYFAVLALWLAGWARTWHREPPAAGFTWQGVTILAGLGALWPLMIVAFGCAIVGEWAMKKVGGSR